MSGANQTRTDLAADTPARGHRAREQALDRLLLACSEHAVELGTYDFQELRWLAGRRPETAHVISDLIHRAAAANERIR